MELQELLGTVQTGTINDQNEQYFFVGVAGFTFRLNKQELASSSSPIRGFLYENQNHQLVMTTKIPVIGCHRYGFGQVVDVRTDLGVFVDIGLQDKDIVVSLDDLPNLKSLWPKKGDRLLIALKVDKKIGCGGNWLMAAFINKLVVLFPLIGKIKM